jgi:hypothetical protein
MTGDQVFADAGRIERHRPGRIIAASGAKITQLRTRLARELEPLAHNRPKARDAVLDDKAGATRNDVFAHEPSITWKRACHTIPISVSGAVHIIRRGPYSMT